MSPAVLRGLLYVAFFASGISALIYEVVWSRYLTLFLGSTSFAHTVVLATFMGGLAFGNAFFGRLADRTKMDKLQLYALLEVGIGLLCLLFPTLFSGISQVYLALGGWTGPASPWNPLLKIAFAVASIFVPCALMGGTLPVLAKYAIGSLSGLGFRLSWLYFINTAGAVAGCLLGGFFVVERLGLEFGMVGTSLLNSTIGGAFYLLYRAGFSRRIEAAEKPAVGEAVQAPEEAPPGEPEYTAAQARTAFWCIAIAGGLTMVYELCWIRLLAMSMGGTVHSFSTMLAGFITGIAVGSGLIGRVLHRRRNALALFALCELGIALSVLVPLRAYERLPYAFYQLGVGVVHSPENYRLYLTVQVAFALMLMLLPTALMGAALPLATRVCVDRLESMARRIGNVFSANTVGSVVGAALTGFVLLPALGLEGTLLLGATVSGGLGIVLLRSWRPGTSGSVLTAARDAVSADRRAGGPSLWPSAVAAVALLALVRLVGYPSWDPRLMQMALYRWERRFGYPTFEAFRQSRSRDTFLWARDGSDASVAVEDRRVEKVLRVNGKPDASSSADLLSQLFVGHLGMFMHPAPQRVMVIGLGSGATAGAVLRHPGTTADVAEISRDVVTAASFFEEVNDSVLKNPRMNLVVVDAREFLLLTREPYDVIVSEPTNVWVPGVASLFTEDFYRVVVARLKPGGLFTQWLPLYSSEPRIVASVVATLRQVFPWVSVWMAEEGDLMFLAGREPPPFDPEAFARRIREVRAADGLVGRNPHVLRLGDPLLFLLLQIATDEGGRIYWAKSGAPPYRDYFPRMEFLAARAQFVGQSYAIYSELDERITPLSPAPLFVSEYLKRHPLGPADRAELRQTLLRQSGTFGRLGRALSVDAAIREGEPLAVLPLPEAMQARVLLARALEEHFREGASLETCQAYLAALGGALGEAKTVLSPPPGDLLVKRGEECIARHPDRAARFKIDLVKFLAGAGANAVALTRLEALDAQGVLQETEPAERAELAALGRRLALVAGQPEAAARWEAVGAGSVATSGARQGDVSVSP